MMQDEHYPFSLPPLPYAYDALEPQLDARTLYFHHDKHFAAYVDALNAVLEQLPDAQNWTLEQLCLNWADLPEPQRQTVRRQAGGVWNHGLYFRTLRPTPASAPESPLREAIDRDFGSLMHCKAALRQASLGVFGSGWAYLTADRTGSLSIRCTANQDTPLPLRPLLCCDVWEHAYYLLYQNRRAEYWENWWQLIDWPQVSQQYADWMAQRPCCPQD